MYLILDFISVIHQLLIEAVQCIVNCFRWHKIPVSQIHLLMTGHDMFNVPPAAPCRISLSSTGVVRYSITPAIFFQSYCTELSVHHELVRSTTVLIAIVHFGIIIVSI